jgi:hypothetical protein
VGGWTDGQKDSEINVAKIVGIFGKGVILVRQKKVNIWRVTAAKHFEDAEQNYIRISRQML